MSGGDQMAITGSNRELKGTDLDPSLNGRCPGYHLQEHSHIVYIHERNQERKEDTDTLVAALNTLGDECTLIQSTLPTPPKTGTVILFFRGGKRHREVSAPAPGHTASTRRSLYLNPL